MARRPRDQSRLDAAQHTSEERMAQAIKARLATLPHGAPDPAPGPRDWTIGGRRNGRTARLAAIQDELGGVGRVIPASAPRLTAHARITRYKAGGRLVLTPAQRRRVLHKAGGRRGLTAPQRRLLDLR
jgi:hypothetical protein